MPFVCMHATLPCQLINIPLPVAMALGDVNTRKVVGTRTQTHNTT